MWMARIESLIVCLALMVAPGVTVAQIQPKGVAQSASAGPGLVGFPAKPIRIVASAPGGNQSDGSKAEVLRCG